MEDSSPLSRLRAGERNPVKEYDRVWNQLGTEARAGLSQALAWFLHGQAAVALTYHPDHSEAEVDDLWDVAANARRRAIDLSMPAPRAERTVVRYWVHWAEAWADLAEMVVHKPLDEEGAREDLVWFIFAEDGLWRDYLDALAHLPR